MKYKFKRAYGYWPYITIGGIIIFIILYVVATFYYPGGSNFDAQQTGFNWSTNYWCELLGRNAKNGQPNTARPIGLIGMLVLAITISIFWLNLPRLIPMKFWYNKLLQTTGILAMLCSIFIYSYYHDLTIYLAVLFGTFAFTLTLYGLYRNHFIGYFNLCVLCVILIFLNNIIYITDYKIEYLPILQKVTFGFVFLWISLISLKFLKVEEISQSKNSKNDEKLN